MSHIDTKITIRDINGNILFDRVVDDSSYRQKETMGDNKLFLHFSTDAPLNLPLFCWTMFKGEKYFLMRPENFKKENTENHEYRLELDTYLAYLKTQKFEFFTSTNKKDMEITFSLSANPQRFLNLIVDNMNMKDTEQGWTVGESIDANEDLLDFDDMYIWDALNMIAEKFSTEWEVEGKTIHLRKVEKQEENPLPLTYGYDGGILPGLTRGNGSERIGVLRVKTSNKNIDSGKYGFKTLKMPRDYVMYYKEEQYITDKTGSKIQRSEPKLKAPVLPEATLDLTNIYPSREGTITEVGMKKVEVDGEIREYYYFIDELIPDDLNFEECLIGGTNMTIIFQTGSLAGMEFEVQYDHNLRKFILSQNIDNGSTYPNAAMRPGIGNSYAVFNVMLPPAYIKEAEQKVIDKAVEYLYENEGDRYIYKFELDPLYAKRNWGEISGYLNIGYFIKLNDPQYLSEPVFIRITGIKEYVNRPYSPEITLSNNVRGQSLYSDIKQIPNINQKITRTGKGIQRITNMRFRDAQELYEKLGELVDLGFSELIEPMAIHSMMAFLGSEQLQFRWVDNTEKPNEIDHYFEMNDETQTFAAAAGTIQHMTLGVDTLSPDHGANEYKFWDIASLPPTYIGDRGFLWLYLKCHKDDGTGSFVLSETEIPMEGGSHYYFLTGSINSAYEGTRNFTTLYGFSVWTPGMLRVPKIASTDGKQYWDMLNKAFHLGDENNYLAYNENKDGKLVLKGTLVQSPSGSQEPLPVFRGQWKSTEMYYRGDEVTYSGSTYRFTSDTPKSGIRPPSNPWAMVAQRGSDGSDGEKGDKGDKGDTGERGVPGLPGALPTLRKWKQYDIYYRDEKKCDYIIYRPNPKDEATWWRLTKDFSSAEAGKTPVGDRAFEQITSFESIATTTLLAEEANLAEFQFKEGFLVSQEPRYSEAEDRNILLNGDTGYAHFAKGNAKFYENGTVDIGNGNIVISSDGKVDIGNGSVVTSSTGNLDITGAFSSNKDGNKVVIDPGSDEKIKLIDSQNRFMGRIGFFTDSTVGNWGEISLNYLSQKGNLEGEMWLNPVNFGLSNGSNVFNVRLKTSNALWVIMNNLPTSNEFLISGCLWRDGDTVKIVP